MYTRCQCHDSGKPTSNGSRCKQVSDSDPAGHPVIASNRANGSPGSSYLLAGGEFLLAFVEWLPDVQDQDANLLWTCCRVEYSRAKERCGCGEQDVRFYTPSTS